VKSVRVHAAGDNDNPHTTHCTKARAALHGSTATFQIRVRKTKFKFRIRNMHVSPV
jgi:hypothetical protein